MKNNYNIKRNNDFSNNSLAWCTPFCYWYTEYSSKMNDPRCRFSCPPLRRQASVPPKMAPPFQM